MRNELGLGSSMSNGSGTVIGIDASAQGPFTSKNRKDRDDESYGKVGISQSPSCSEMIRQSGGIQQ